MLERVNCERCKYIGLREQHSFLRASSHSLFFCRTAQLVHYFHWNKYYSSCSYGRKVTEWHVLSPARQRMAGDIETQVVLNSNRIRRYCIFYKKKFSGGLLLCGTNIHWQGNRSILFTIHNLHCKWQDRYIIRLSSFIDEKVK